MVIVIIACAWLMSIFGTSKSVLGQSIITTDILYYCTHLLMSNHLETVLHIKRFNFNDFFFGRRREFCFWSLTPRYENAFNGRCEVFTSHNDIPNWDLELITCKQLLQYGPYISTPHCNLENGRMNFELDLHHSPSYTHPIQTANNNRLTSTLFPTKYSQPFSETQSVETFFPGNFSSPTRKTVKKLQHL